MQSMNTHIGRVWWIYIISDVKKHVAGHTVYDAATPYADDWLFTVE